MAGFTMLLPVCIMAALAVNAIPTIASPIEKTEFAEQLNRNVTDELRIYNVESDYVLKRVRFLLWTRQNRDDFKQLTTGDVSSLTESEFNSNLPTKIYIHGFVMNGYSHPQVLTMRDAYLDKEDCNFITVDWGLLALFPLYVRAVTYTNIVGEHTGDFINFLVDQGAKLEDFHVIGFSLGSHVAGKAGATVNGLLPRITGLDPAYPLFSIDNTDTRLDTTDAEFVDVIHTNSGYITDIGLSFPFAIGHADFFPNGGTSQAGCGILISGGLTDLIFSCSHNRVMDLYTESINSETGFKAVACDSWENFQDGQCSDGSSALMGEPASSTNLGTFYLATNGESTYAI